MGILADILGTGDVIKEGFKLIDNMHTSESEEIEAKAKAAQAATKSKIELMGAYAPFKIAQRYIALQFTFVYLASFVLVLIMSLFSIGDVSKVLDVIDIFYVGAIMLMIVGFYFSGGMAEGTIREWRRKKDD